jgi:hypothetical protein
MTTAPMDRAEAATLWRRWRMAAVKDAAAIAEPNASLLAAYAENRLSPTAAAAVEDWLADHPEAIGDILAARQAGEPAASATVIARATALIAAAEAGVVAFRAKAQIRTSSWRVAIACGGMAASFLITSALGLSLGYDAYMNFSGTSPSLVQEALDPPAGLFNSTDEDSTI